MTKRVGSLNPHGAPVLYRQILANSITVTELDSVTMDSDGFVALGTTGTLVFGHVMGISDSNQVGLLTTGVAGAAIGSFEGTYGTASDNETVGMVTAVMDISKHALYSMTPDVAIGKLKRFLNKIFSMPPVYNNLFNYA